jgi:L-ascorbate metabolism protein UlaG (beta-lactamase superfamily)
MRVRWFGQSAFLLEGGRRVMIDPFGDIRERFQGRGIEWLYPPITDVAADLLLVTHEHLDHNGVEVVAGGPVVIRSTAGRLDSPVGEVVAVASEHDPRAGTERGPNTIFCFALDDLRICHFGDFGQAELRPEQVAAIGQVDLLFVPVGGQATIDGPTAAIIVRQLQPRVAVPMHYRNPAISFLEPPEGFYEAFGGTVAQLPGPELVVDEHLGDETVVVAPAPPLAA